MVQISEGNRIGSISNMVQVKDSTIDAELPSLLVDTNDIQSDSYKYVFFTQIPLRKWNHGICIDSISTDRNFHSQTYDIAAELTLVPPVDTLLPDNDMGGNPVDTFALLVSPGVAQSGSP